MKTEVYFKDGTSLIINGGAKPFHNEEEYILVCDEGKYTVRKSDVRFIKECKN